MSARHFTVCFLCTLFFVFTIPFSCSLQSDEETLARKYCSSCHLFPDASLLDKQTWEKNVLPKMGAMLGVSFYMGEYFIDRFSDNSKSAISLKDWDAVVNYYSKEAPEKPLKQERPAIKEYTNQFLINEGIIEGSSPSATYVKIDPGNRHIYVANAFDSLFIVFDQELRLLQKQKIGKIAVDIDFVNNLNMPGERSGVLTNIGILNPNDVRAGSLERFTIPQDGNIKMLSTVWDSIPRPVQTSAADLDKDGKMDYLVCGFGNYAGAFFYIRDKGVNQYEQKMLRALPGAIRAYVDDFNKDGLPDIMALMAQADEGIFLFLNKGKGEFAVQELLRFSPVNGSSYFELADINGDGLKDIVYTNGDNLDYTSHVLKHYHGVSIYLNKGANKFKREYFFPIHGCYKAIARDFDNDGDADLATISYSPDKKGQPQESFVYLKNNGNLKFTPYAIKQYGKGNWIVMDAGDVDADGDEDIIIGSMVLPTDQVTADELKNKPSFLLLVNQTK